MSNKSKTNYSALAIPRNKSTPIRIAFLGGPRTGKTSLISKLTTGNYGETYYPLRKTTPILFAYRAELSKLRCFLDPSRRAEAIAYSRLSAIILSSVVNDALQKCRNESENTRRISESATTVFRNSIYYAYPSEDDSKMVLTPILTELIDTPAFKTEHSVPFLEVSLHARLAKDVLRNLANDAGQTVNAEPLLVASGATELNATVDGYVFVYSAVPSAQPPAYDFQKTEQELSNECTLYVLPAIKQGLIEAWSEYYSYKTRSVTCAESDIFSLKTAFKNIFYSKARKDSFDEKLEDVSSDSFEKLCLPPIVIVCTHTALPLTSPMLIQEGKNLAKEWECGFVAVDVSDDVSCVLDLMIRELVERKVNRKSR